MGAPATPPQDHSADEILLQKLQVFRSIIDSIELEKRVSKVSLSSTEIEPLDSSDSVKFKSSQTTENASNGSNESGSPSRYSYEQFCDDLDTSNDYVLRLLELLVKEAAGSSYSPRRQPSISQTSISSDASNTENFLLDDSDARPTRRDSVRWASNYGNDVDEGHINNGISYNHGTTDGMHVETTSSSRSSIDENPTSFTPDFSSHYANSRNGLWIDNTPLERELIVSRRGSMWDAYDDPSLQGLVVQEFNGVDVNGCE